MKKWVNGEIIDMTAEEIAEAEARYSEYLEAEKNRPLNLDEVINIVLPLFLKNDREIADEDAVRMVDFYPVWEVGKEYAQGERFVHDGVLYKSNQLHTSSDIYPPTVQSSLYSRVLAVDGVISEWEQPNATNPYMMGDKVSYGGKTYESTVDNNVWSPTTYGWKEVN